MTQTRGQWIPLLFALALFVPGPALAHASPETLEDTSYDPVGAFPVIAGGHCSRTDMQHVQLTPVHGAIDGTEVRFQLEDLSQPCPTEADSELFRYEARLEAANADRVLLWIEVNQDMVTEEVRLAIDADNRRLAFGCDGPGCAEIDIEESTITYTLLDDFVEPPFEEAFFTTEMDLCHVGVCSVRGTTAEDHEEYADRAPNVGRTSFFT